MNFKIFALIVAASFVSMVQATPVPVPLATAKCTSEADIRNVVNDYAYTFEKAYKARLFVTTDEYSTPRGKKIFKVMKTDLDKALGVMQSNNLRDYGSADSGLLKVVYEKNQNNAIIFTKYQKNQISRLQKNAKIFVKIIGNDKTMSKLLSTDANIRGAVPEDCQFKVDTMIYYENFYINAINNEISMRNAMISDVTNGCVA